MLFNSIIPPHHNYILITGGAGFIGSHIVPELISKYKIIIADNLSNSIKENIDKRAIFYKIDIKNYKKLELIFKKYKIDIIIHLAGQISSKYSLNFPIKDANENIIATLNIITLSKKYNIKKLFVSSSASVYGNCKLMPIDEDCMAKPISYYGVSKLSMEKYIEISNIDYIIFRLSNVYGPKKNCNSLEKDVITTFINNILNNENIEIYGDGNQTRDFIYVKDVAKIFSLFIDKEDIKNTIINVSTNIPITINELYKKLKVLTNKATKIDYLKGRDGDIKNSVLNNEKLLKVIKFNFTDIEIGLNETLEYLKNKRQ